MCAVVSLLTKPKPAAELEGLIWTRDSLSVPAEQQAGMRGLRNPVWWWAFVMALVLYFFVKYP